MKGVGNKNGRLKGRDERHRRSCQGGTFWRKAALGLYCVVKIVVGGAVLGWRMDVCKVLERSQVLE